MGEDACLSTIAAPRSLLENGRAAPRVLQPRAEPSAQTHKADGPSLWNPSPSVTLPAFSFLFFWCTCKVFFFFCIRSLSSRSPDRKQYAEHGHATAGDTQRGHHTRTGPSRPTEVRADPTNAYVRAQPKEACAGTPGQSEADRLSIDKCSRPLLKTLIYISWKSECIDLQHVPKTLVRDTYRAKGYIA